VTAKADPPEFVCPTRDEATAAAFHELAQDGGGVVVIHRADCATVTDDECNCTPEVHTVAPAAKEQKS
jgi:uncharacterized protein (DUF362 family)